jgi:hypothetical protein
LTGSAQVRDAIDRMLSGTAMSAFHAAQQASMIA